MSKEKLRGKDMLPIQELYSERGIADDDVEGKLAAIRSVIGDVRMDSEWELGIWNSLQTPAPPIERWVRETKERLIDGVLDREDEGRNDLFDDPTIDSMAGKIVDEFMQRNGIVDLSRPPDYLVDLEARLELMEQTYEMRRTRSEHFVLVRDVFANPGGPPLSMDEERTRFNAFLMAENFPEEDE